MGGVREGSFSNIKKNKFTDQKWPEFFLQFLAKLGYSKPFPLSFTFFLFFFSNIGGGWGQESIGKFQYFFFFLNPSLTEPQWQLQTVQRLMWGWQQISSKIDFTNMKGISRIQIEGPPLSLSSHIWDLKDSNTPYSIKWEVVRRANTFSPVTKRCDLCIAEKLEIIYNQGKATLNKRHEVFNHCRHRVGKLLVKKKRRRRIPGD